MLAERLINTHNRSLLVLVVENNPDHQLLIGYSMRARMPEAEPVFLLDVHEAITYLDQCLITKAPFPQLVLLDIHLPQPGSGWQLLKEFRAHYPRLPVIVLSTRQDQDDVKRAYELGAHSFIEKPSGLQHWEHHFQALRTYWLGTVSLPPTY